MRFSVIHKVGVVSHRPRQHGSPVDEAPCWPRTHSKFFKGVLALTSRSSSRSAVACKLVACGPIRPALVRRLLLSS